MAIEGQERYDIFIISYSTYSPNDREVDVGSIISKSVKLEYDRLYDKVSEREPEPIDEGFELKKIGERSKTDWRFPSFYLYVPDHVTILKHLSLCIDEIRLSPYTRYLGGHNHMEILNIEELKDPGTEISLIEPLNFLV